MKTYIVALLLLLFYVLVSIVCGRGLVSVARMDGQAGIADTVAGGFVQSTVELPLFLSNLGLSRTLAGLCAFATWFVYAVGVFQLVTVRVISREG